jgi:hypothetical protein
MTTTYAPTITDMLAKLGEAQREALTLAMANGDDLRRQLTVARQEIAKRDEKIASQDEEIAALRAKLEGGK